MPLSISDYSSKLPDVETTIFTTIGNLARKHNAIDLSQGFPNFDADPHLIDLVHDAMKAGHNQYAPMQGNFRLRETICEKISNLHGSAYHPESEITITVGATQAIFTAITTFVHANDEVIVFKPAYDCYEPAIILNGGIPVCVQLDSPDYEINWSIVEKNITPNTKMIILNTPHNPSGRVVTKDDMLALQALLKGTNIILISDEVYEHIIFDDKEHQSASRFPELASRSFVCASFGKTFHITGWKMGYCVAPKALMQEFQKVHQFNVFSVDHPVQHALNSYLKNEENYLSLNVFYQGKRNFFLKQLLGSKFKFKPTQGSYFQLLDYTAITEIPDTAFAELLIKVNGLASIPISSFNTNNRDDKMLRFCFAKTDETLKRATEILVSI